MAAVSEHDIGTGQIAGPVFLLLCFLKVTQEIFGERSTNMMKCYNSMTGYVSVLTM